jgi:hypothetical protein
MAINWQQVVTTFVATVGGGGVLLGAAAWLIKTLLSHRLAREAEQFKAKLQADADVQKVKLQADANSQIERLKTALQMSALEHQVRFSKLHERRGEVIADLHARILRTERVAAGYVLQGGHHSDSKTRSEEFSKAIETLRDFYICFADNRIYLPKRICDLIDTLVKKAQLSVIGIDIYGRIEYATPQTVDQRTKAFKECFDAFEKDIPVVITTLEDEFRKILGVEVPPAEV